MAKKSAPRVGLDADVEVLMQGIAQYHGGNLTAAVNYALRLAAPAILHDLQAYRPLPSSYPTTTGAVTTQVSTSPSIPHRSNAEKLLGAKL